jgi:hypothetical protein
MFVAHDVTGSEQSICTELIDHPALTAATVNHGNTSV